MIWNLKLPGLLAKGNPDRRFKMHCGVYLVMQNTDRKVLLIRRWRTGYFDGFLSLPSGGVDGGERLVDAVVREANGELGVEIEPANLQLAHVMHRFKRQGDERLDFFFRCHSWSGHPRICEPHKHDRLMWADLSCLPHNLIPYHRRAIVRLLDGVTLSYDGWNLQ